jgi:hypothetical protein
MHSATLTEIREYFPSVWVQRVQILAALSNDASLGPIGPVGNPARTGTPEIFRPPEWWLGPAGLPGSYIERFHESNRIWNIPNTINDQWRSARDIRIPKVWVHLPIPDIDDRPAPGDLQRPNVVGVDLIEWRVLCTA